MAASIKILFELFSIVWIPFIFESNLFEFPNIVEFKSFLDVEQIFL